MRSSEQFSLRWPQIDTDHCILFLPKTKNGKSRHVPLNAVAMEALRILKQRHDDLSPHSPWVFLNESGEQLRGHRDWFEPALQDSGVPDYSWHCNRHTFASRLVMAGGDLRTDPKMTWRYSHLAPSHQQRAVDRLVPAEDSAKTRKTEGQSATRSATSSVVAIRALAIWLGKLIIIRALQTCESGGIGRRTRLRIWRVKPWGFESPLSHQLFDYKNQQVTIAKKPSYIKLTHPPLGCPCISKQFNAAKFFAQQECRRD